MPVSVGAAPQLLRLVLRRVEAPFSAFVLAGMGARLDHGGCTGLWRWWAHRWPLRVAAPEPHSHCVARPGRWRQDQTGPQRGYPLL